MEHLKFNDLRHFKVKIVHSTNTGRYSFLYIGVVSSSVFGAITITQQNYPEYIVHSVDDCGAIHLVDQ